MAKLRLYRLDMKYVRELARIDSNVMSVSPQAGKATRPFVGIVIVNADRTYCIPLSSPKPKHARMRNGRDFTKVFDPKGHLIAVLNINNMIPVNQDVIHPVDLKARATDDDKLRAYKALMRNQIDLCNDHAEEIMGKANRLYQIVTKKPEKYRGLVSRCCNFARLEEVLDARE